MLYQQYIYSDNFEITTENTMYLFIECRKGKGKIFCLILCKLALSTPILLSLIVVKCNLSHKSMFCIVEKVDKNIHTTYLC